MGNEPSKLQAITLSDAVVRMTEDCGKPAKAICSEVGKAYSTLMRELDLADDGAKIGVDTLLPLIRACCGSSPETPPLPLQWLSARLGFRCVPVSRHQADAEVSPDAVRAMRILVDFISLCEDPDASLEAVTYAYDAAITEIEQFATRAARERDGYIALPSLRHEREWWRFWKNKG